MNKAVKGSKSWVFVIVLFLILVVILSLNLSFIRSKPKIGGSPIITKSKDAINIAKQTGLLLKIDPQMNEAFVNSLMWHRLDYQTKENIARAMASYCEDMGDTAWIEIKDYKSGRKLAKYSSLGFKTYQ